MTNAEILQERVTNGAQEQRELVEMRRRRFALISGDIQSEGQEDENLLHYINKENLDDLIAEVGDKVLKDQDILNKYNRQMENIAGNSKNGIAPDQPFKDNGKWYMNWSQIPEEFEKLGLAKTFECPLKLYADIRFQMIENQNSIDLEKMRGYFVR